MADGLVFEVETFANLNTQLKAFKTNSQGVGTRLEEVGRGLKALFGAFDNRIAIDNMDVFNNNFALFSSTIKNLNKEESSRVVQIGKDIKSFADSISSMKAIDVNKLNGIDEFFTRIDLFYDSISKLGAPKTESTNALFDNVTLFVVRVEAFAKSFGSSVAQIEKHLTEEKITKIQPVIKVMQGLLGVVKVGHHISKIADFDKVLADFSHNMHRFIENIVNIMKDIGKVQIPNEKNMRSILISMVYVSKYVETISKVDMSVLKDNQENVFKFLNVIFKDMFSLFNIIASAKIKNEEKLQGILKNVRSLLGILKQFNILNDYTIVIKNLEEKTVFASLVRIFNEFKTMVYVLSSIRSPKETETRSILALNKSLISIVNYFNKINDYSGIIKNIADRNIFNALRDIFEHFAQIASVIAHLRSPKEDKAKQVLAFNKMLLSILNQMNKLYEFDNMINNISNNLIFDALIDIFDHFRDIAYVIAHLRSPKEDETRRVVNLAKSLISILNYFNKLHDFTNLVINLTTKNIFNAITMIFADFRQLVDFLHKIRSPKEAEVAKTIGVIKGLISILNYFNKLQDYENAIFNLVNRRYFFSLKAIFGEFAILITQLGDIRSDREKEVKNSISIMKNLIYILEYFKKLVDKKLTIDQFKQMNFFSSLTIIFLEMRNFNNNHVAALKLVNQKKMEDIISYFKSLIKIFDFIQKFDNFNIANLARFTEAAEAVFKEMISIVAIFSAIRIGKISEIRNMVNFVNAFKVLADALPKLLSVIDASSGYDFALNKIDKFFAYLKKIMEGYKFFLGKSSRMKTNPTNTRIMIDIINAMMSLGQNITEHMLKNGNAMLIVSFDPDEHFDALVRFMTKFEAFNKKLQKIKINKRSVNDIQNVISLFKETTTAMRNLIKDMPFDNLDMGDFQHKLHMIEVMLFGNQNAQDRRATQTATNVLFGDNKRDDMVLDGLVKFVVRLERYQKILRTVSGRGRRLWKQQALNMDFVQDLVQTMLSFVNMFNTIANIKMDFNKEKVVENLDMMRRMIFGEFLGNLLMPSRTGFVGIIRRIGSEVKQEDIAKLKVFFESLKSLVNAFETVASIKTGFSKEAVIESLDMLRRLIGGIPLLPIGGIFSLIRRVGKIPVDSIKSFSLFTQSLAELGRAFKVLARLDSSINENAVVNALGLLRRIFSATSIVSFGGLQSMIARVGKINPAHLANFRKYTESLLDTVKSLVLLANTDLKGLDFKSIEKTFSSIYAAMEKSGLKNTDLNKLGKSHAKGYVKGWDEGLERRSPSRVFIRMGRDVVEGFKRGISTIVNVSRDIVNKIINIFKGMTNTFKQLFGSLANVITGPFHKMQNLFSKIFRDIGQRLRYSLNDIRMFTGGLGSIFGGVAIEFEKGLAQVFKTIEIPEESKKEIQATLTQQFREMATGKGSVLSGLENASATILEIAEVAGTLGIAIEDMEKFTQTVGAMTIATNLGGEEAATFLGQFAAITGNTEFDRTASTMVTLGNQFAATESGIAEFSNRIAGVGVSFGLSVPEILAFSAAMESVGLNPEAGGTAFSQIMAKSIDALAKGGTELELFARAAGMTGAELKELQKGKPAEFLLEMLKGFSQYPLDEQVVLFDQLGLDGIRISDTLRRLGNANELVAKSLDVANTGWRENSALMDEARIRNETTDASIQRLKNRFYDIKITIGQFFAPIVKLIADSLGNIVMSFNLFIQNLTNSFALLNTPLDNLKSKVENAFGVVAGDASAAQGGGPIAKELEKLRSGFDADLGMYQEVTIQQGDTLWGLAQKYKVSVEELREWNSLSKDSIYHAGDTIKIWSKVGAEGEDLTSVIEEQVEKMRNLENQMKSGGRAVKGASDNYKLFGKNINSYQLTKVKDDLSDLSGNLKKTKEALGSFFSGDVKKSASDLSVAVGGVGTSFKNVLASLTGQTDQEIEKNPFIITLTQMKNQINNKDWEGAFKSSLVLVRQSFQSALSSVFSKIGFGEREVVTGAPDIADVFAFEQTGMPGNDTLSGIKTETRSLFGFNEALAERIKEIGEPTTFADEINLAILNIRKLFTEIANGDFSGVKKILEDNISIIVRTSIVTGLTLAFPAAGIFLSITNWIVTAIDKDLLGLRTQLEKSEVGKHIVSAVDWIIETIEETFYDITTFGEYNNLDYSEIFAFELTGDPNNDTLKGIKSTDKSLLKPLRDLIESIKEIADYIRTQIDWSGIEQFAINLGLLTAPIIKLAGEKLLEVGKLAIDNFLKPAAESLVEVVNKIAEIGPEKALLITGASLAIYTMIKNITGGVGILKAAGTKLLTMGKLGIIFISVTAFLESLPTLVEAASKGIDFIMALLSGDSEGAKKSGNEALLGLGESVVIFFDSVKNSSFTIMEMLGLGDIATLKRNFDIATRELIVKFEDFRNRIQIIFADIQRANPFASQEDRDKASGIKDRAQFSFMVGDYVGNQIPTGKINLDNIITYTDQWGREFDTTLREYLNDPNKAFGSLQGTAGYMLQVAGEKLITDSANVDLVLDGLTMLRGTSFDFSTLTPEAIANLPILNWTPQNEEEAMKALFLNNMFKTSGLAVEIPIDPSLLKVSLDSSFNFTNALEGFQATDGMFPNHSVALSEEQKNQLYNFFLYEMGLTQRPDEEFLNTMLGSPFILGLQEEMGQLFEKHVIKDIAYAELTGNEQLRNSWNNLIGNKLLDITRLYGPETGQLMSEILGNTIAAELMAMQMFGAENANFAINPFLGGLATGDEMHQLQEMSGEIQSGFGTMGQLGAGVFNNIALGMKQASLTDVVIPEVATNITKELKDTVEDELDMNSPSGVFKGYGKNIIEGLEKGISDNLSTLTKSVENIVRELETVAIMTAVMANRVAISLSGIILGLVVFNSTFALSTTILKLNLLTMRSDLDLFIDKIEDAILALARMRLAFAVSGAGNDSNYGFQPTDKTSFYGGYTAKGEKHEVLENNLPFETYRTSKGKTYLISNENGQIYSPAKTRQVNAAAGVGMSRTEVNEGDVYITVNGSGNPEAVAEAVMKKLEKEKARGTMRTLRLSGASGV